MFREFNYYLEKSLARRSTPNKGEARALMKKAEGRLVFSIKSREINDDTATYVFEDIYECLSEAAQSLMSLKGFKPYSHEALLSFLREHFSFSESDLRTFDRYRILRNKAVYGGERISTPTCEEALVFLKSFLPVLQAEFRRLIK